MTAPEEKRELTDDIKLADLTVGEFRQLMQEFLMSAPLAPVEEKPVSEDENISAKKKSLDEFMNDLEG